MQTEINLNRTWQFHAHVDNQTSKNVWSHKLHLMGFKKKMRQSQEMGLDLGEEGEYDQNTLHEILKELNLKKNLTKKGPKCLVIQHVHYDLSC